MIRTGDSGFYDGLKVEGKPQDKPTEDAYAQPKGVQTRAAIAKHLA